MIENRKLQGSGPLKTASLPVYKEDEKVGAKALKQEAKNIQTTTTNAVEYDTDTTSLVYMNAVTNLANFKFIQALVAQDSNLQSLYDAVYKTSIGWKGTDNAIHNVQMQSIILAMENAMNQVAGVVGAD